MINTDDGQVILDALRTKTNLFITGSAGSGKTYLASDYGNSKENTILTATTGIAALLLGGETIHRFLGLGITARPELCEKIISGWEKIKKSKASWDKIKWMTVQNLDTIIIDEASMLRRDQFELIDVVLSHIKNIPTAFGGVQVVLVGDFLQLPPVVTNIDLKNYPDLNRPYCFQSDLWDQARFQEYNLTSNYRQGEEDFIKVLEKIRIGHIDSQVIDTLNSRVGAKMSSLVEPVKLFSLKKDVTQENMFCLKNLPGNKLVSEAEFTGSEYERKILEKCCPAEKDLYFGKDAQIVMLTNDPQGTWVNGTMGIIKSVNPISIELSNGKVIVPPLHVWERKVPKVLSCGTIKNEVVATMKQYPFALAYAATIHKSQGLTLDYVDVDLSECFVAGQAYVALSRVKTLSGLTLRGWNKSLIQADPRVLDFYDKDKK